jgi:hypothetical protein
MRLLLIALALVVAIAAVINTPGPIVSTDRNRSAGLPVPRTHGRTAIARIASWPTLDPATINRLDPAAIERAIDDEWVEARRK